MVDGGILDHRQFIKALVTLCRERSSGTVFYNLSSGLSARIVMNRGEISWLAFGEHRGAEAIEAIRLIDSGRMSFNPSLKLTIGKQTLPTTPEILKLINTRSHERKSRPKGTNHKSTNSKPINNQSSLGRVFNKNEVCEIVVKESTEFVGPIARIVCDEYMKSQPTQISLNSVHKLIDNMVLDIDDEAKGNLFKGRVNALLQLD
ncbi:MAG: hypothetical protein N0C88_05640 [Candidatus Thiodiazotropha lotti]|uniref:DUF8082 domain-containing protein n=1 Tax=Candidatus Thiodiazotropha lotti TaxID=2792787 RepID=A0A9E4N0B4_9GAMM|nr:hypothetical protein [Candidatus Thiodiazotropha lotti]MCG7938329.1 hypothetical protein [Candidatus Thiodiazotropha lotti]MCW4202797.1 hypothetical protein [Candidatus Thiodiazotropha lotti]ODC00742.1 hypothetical protein A3197_10610 [Candidatus Thiodiazotropha endoloripes]